MRIVLDESVPRPLARKLRSLGLDVATFPNEWKGTKNGQLLARAAQAGYTCLLTCDKNMTYQQNIEQLTVLIAVLPSQDAHVLMEDADGIARALLAEVRPGGALLIASSGNEHR